MTTSSTLLTDRKIVDELMKCGTSHIVWLPDSETHFMYEAMMGQPEITLVPICREGEAIAIAVGLLLGGKKPVVLHQNTGFFESGDSIRAMALDYKLPLLILLGYRGWRRDAPMTDSAGIFLEPFLGAFGIKYHLVVADEDVMLISESYKEAHETNRPVVVLIGREEEQT